MWNIIEIKTKYQKISVNIPEKIIPKSRNPLDFVRLSKKLSFYSGYEINFHVKKYDEFFDRFKTWEQIRVKDICVDDIIKMLSQLMKDSFERRYMGIVYRIEREFEIKLMFSERAAIREQLKYVFDVCSNPSVFQRFRY